MGGDLGDPGQVPGRLEIPEVLLDSAGRLKGEGPGPAAAGGDLSPPFRGEAFRPHQPSPATQKPRSVSRGYHGGIVLSAKKKSTIVFTGSHYGWTDQSIEKGMLVGLAGENRYHHNNPGSEIVYGIEKSQMENDPAVLGAYLAIEDPNDPVGDDNHLLVMAVGNGVIWVVDDGEDLRRGISPGSLREGLDTSPHLI